MSSKTCIPSRFAPFCAAAVSLLALSSLTSAALAQVTPYGSGVNPPGSLAVQGGIPMVGASFILGVSNTASDSASASLAFLFLATSPDAAFPAGTVLEGFGLSPLDDRGELLLSLSAPNPVAFLGPVAWAGGAASPASFQLSVPPLPALSGLTLYLQGALVDVVGPRAGLTNGLAVTLTEPDFIGLVPIAAGTFQMGSDAPDGAPYFGELGAPNPVRQVTISKPFWMGRHEVTQNEYFEQIGTNPSFPVGGNRPVTNVSWFKAAIYCEQLNAEQTALGRVPLGYQYRLPTEAEWEYACRAGTTTEFHFGPELLCDQARISLSQHSTPAAGCNNPSGATVVGSYAPNAWGLFDMHGNVAEWTLDSYTGVPAATDTDPYVSGEPLRIFRGGSWAYGSENSRSAVRPFGISIGASSALGFRVVLAPIIDF